MKQPPDWKLEKLLKSTGSKVTLHKVTENLIDDEFGQTQVSEFTFQIYAEVQDITLEDMSYLPAGMVKEGDKWGYFSPIYYFEGDPYEVKVNDYITFKGIKYLVVRIEDSYMAGETVARRALLRRTVG